MIKPEQVPDEAIVPAAISLAQDNGWPTQNAVYVCGEVVRAIIAAAINAWPGAAVCHYTIGDNEGYEMVLPIPFPQEGGDEQA